MDKTTKTLSHGSHEKEINKFCSFYLTGRLFGVDILNIKEVTSETEFTNIHHAPPAIRGYVNIRGQINLVVDLKCMLRLGSAAVIPGSKVILFKAEVGENFGILVDKIGDIIEADESKIEYKKHVSNQADQADDTLNELEKGVCKLDKALMSIIDPSKIFGVIQEKYFN